MTLTPPRHADARRRFAQRSARSRGVVIIIALLATILIAGLIGYVFNTGRHAQLRMETQNAADATAISGAGYLARSFNVVAMNNVEISRLIATVQHLDALPLAVEYTLTDEIAHREALQRINSGPIANRDVIGQILLDQIAEQDRDIQILEEMNDFFLSRANDVQDLTFYDGPTGRGELWRAMEALDAISEATMENLGQLAQVAAIEAGTVNMAYGESGVAAIVPFNPEFPWERYGFDAFERPVARGMLPNYVDNPTTNRGPYDAVFGWRNLDIDTEYGPSTGSETVDRGGGFSSGWSRRTGGGGSRPVISRTVSGYRTYGTWNWLARQFLSMNAELNDTAIWTRFSGMSQVKLNYLWPGQSRRDLFTGISEPDNIEHARAPTVFLDPEWILDYEEAKAIRDAGTPRIVYARYLSVEMQRTETYVQVFIDGDSQGNRQLVSEFENEARSEVINSFNRREFFSPPGLSEDERIGQVFWVDEMNSPDVYTAVSTTNQTINGREREVTRVTTREIYSTFYFFWLGVNVGPTIEIRNPNNFSSRTDLPSPIDFQHDQITRPIGGQPGQPGDPFAILALAAQPNRANMWPERFNRSAHDSVTAIAQAAVFNNHSWDLWTQMWYGQLEPVQDFPGWVDYANAVRGDAAVYPDLDQGELDRTLQYFNALRPLSDTMLNH